MFKLFRQIRKSLLKDGKLRHYLTYGVGEIILVVIGILLALQINSWNQARVNRILEKAYLQRIQQDLSHDSTLFRSRIAEGEAGIEALKKLMRKIYTKQNNYKEIFEISDLYEKGWVHVFNPQNSTYIELESTGLLKIIRKESLRNAIINHYARYRLAEEEFKRAFDWVTGLTQHLDKETSLIKFASGAKAIFTKPEMFSDEDWAFINKPDDIKFKIFERASSARAEYVKINLDLYAELHEATADLLDLINTELE